jgi:penicillin-binding protein 2
LGFLGEVKEDEVGLLRPNGGRFDVGDLIGRSGVEEAWDERLRGMDGGRLVEVDNTGEQVRELGMKLPVAGQEVKLALDMELQQVADEAMGKHVGAVVASNPKTGGVLVMVSKPGFDPNTIYDEYANLISQDGRPLVNRAIGGIYPPGSTFKMVTTVAALESGKLPLAYTYQDTGVVSVGTYRYTNWFFTQSGGVEGVIGFRKAIARSTDTFFYKVGEETGVMEIAKWAQEFGLGHKTGVEIAGEVEGLVPDPDWKKAVKKEAWFLGDTFIMSIGQGDLLTTPAQVNRMTNVIASRGQKCSLSLIEMERPCEAMMVDEKIWDVVQRGMLDACSTGGTAYPFFDWNQKFEQKVACKTGTAEYLMKDGKTGTHAWLTAYAPADAPTISVTVLIEAGGEGSRTAAPVVRKVLARYFGVEDNFDYQGYLPRGE